MRKKLNTDTLLLAFTSAGILAFAILSVFDLRVAADAALCASAGSLTALVLVTCFRVAGQ